MTEPAAYSIRSAATAYDVSVDTIRAAIRSGSLEAKYPTPGKALIKRAELERWLDDAPTHAERQP